MWWSLKQITVASLKNYRETARLATIIYSLLEFTPPPATGIPLLYCGGNEQCRLYDGLKLARGWCIHHATNWNKYKTELNTVATQMETIGKKIALDHPPKGLPATTQAAAASLPNPLDPKVRHSLGLCARCAFSCLMGALLTQACGRLAARIRAIHQRAHVNPLPWLAAPPPPRFSLLPSFHTTLKVNEQLLLHGTTPQNLYSLLITGLNERFSGDLI
jgi:hypothetical protein